MSTTITVCETCKRTNWNAEIDNKTDGEVLADLIESMSDEAPNINIRRHACLMGCDFACNVAIQSENKLNYVLGNFSPNIESAQGIIEYAKLHDASEKGQVPFRDWPQEIKGHFRARLPVLGNN
jgi:predicted metal-binding protein